ncbi:MAG: choice-of-anchor J domain-containing protein [Prevotellaceae bacterium]|jgi:PKD repeat protein|nr:choice-of-anchor J domain-containing protein [Prevotellaceae bacterium]
MKNLRLILSMVCLLALGFTENRAGAQQTRGGTPPTFSVNEAQALPAQAYVKVPVNFSVTELLIEDSINVNSGDIGRPRFAKDIPVDITMENSGVWTELPNGQRVWRLAVEAKNALALIISYEEFYLPAGSQLFIYNADRTQVLGAYDNISNSYGKQYSTPLVAGDISIFEYVEPLQKAGDKALLRISSIGYAYSNIKIAKLPDANVPEAGSPGGSNPTSLGNNYTCHVDIACTEGEGWREEAGSAACYMYTRITGYGWIYCSSALINNTANDKTPYIITAWHCGANGPYTGLTSDADFLVWQFYFFYENSACGVAGGYENNEMLTGSTVVASTGGYTDGLLLKLVQPIPDAWITSGRLYFAGWDKRDVAPTSGVSINYPYAIPKKIATFTSPASSTGNINFGFADCGSSNCSTMANSMWNTNMVKTDNGWGRSESGASGGPLFNQNKRLVGTLSGTPTSGNASCTASSGNFNVRFGKLAYHWDKVGSTTATQMKTWLDPVGNGTADSCPPYPNDDTPIVMNPFGFNADRTDMYALESATFTITNSSSGENAYVIDSVKWEFESGTPAVSVEQQPTVAYNTATGSPFNVRLSVYTKKPDTGIDTIFEVAKADYINVTVKGGSNAGVPVANVAAIASAAADTLFQDNGYQQRIVNTNGVGMGNWGNTTVASSGSPTWMKANAMGESWGSTLSTTSWTRTNYAWSANNGYSGYGYGATAAGNDSYFYAFSDYNYIATPVRMYNRTAMNFGAFAGKSATLKFKFKNVAYTSSSGSKYYDGLYVQYSNTNTSETSWTTVKTIEEYTSESATSGTAGWIDVEVELPDLTSTYYIAFTSMGDDCEGGGSGDGMGIDNIEIVIEDVDELPHVILWEGEDVDFYDLSTGVPVLYEYEFPGGEPATSTSDAPKITVRYDNAGFYDIKQKVTNTFGTDDTVRTGYVEVKRTPIDPFDFSADRTDLYAVESAAFTISYIEKSYYAYLIDSVKWEFQGGTPSESVEQQPVIAYNTATGSPFDVSMTVYATDTISGTDTVFIKQKTGYINVTVKGGSSAGPPVANVAAVDFVEYSTPIVSDNGMISINGSIPVATTVSSSGTTSTYVKTLVSGTMSALANSSWTRTNNANSSGSGNSAMGNTGYGYGATSSTYSTNYFYSFFCYSYGGNPHVRMYNRQPLVLDTITKATLKFKFKNRSWSGYWDAMDVQYCNTNPVTGTWATIKTIDQATTTTTTTTLADTAKWITVEVELPNLTSTYYIGFKSNGTDCEGGAGGYGMGIDNIEIYGISIDEKSHVILWEGENVDFYDLSTGVPVLYEYEFEGGEPATSTSDAPIINVRYDNAGLYDISQIVRNSFGADTMVRDDYVEVKQVILKTDTALIVADCNSEINAQIILTANKNWTVLSKPSWVSLSPSSGSVAVEGTEEDFYIQLTVPEQDEFTGRIDTVVFIIDNGVKTAKVTVRQAPASPTGFTAVIQNDDDVILTWDVSFCEGETEESKCNIIDVGGGGLDEEDFPEWTIFTEGEGYGWEWSDYPDDVHSGIGAAASFSWYGNNQLFHADNWLVSPKVRITENYHTLTYYVQSLDSDPYDDYYEVHLSTAPDITSTADFDAVIKPLSQAGQEEYIKENINLSAYIGQEVYIAFRHLDYNKYGLTIDDVSGLELASCLDESGERGQSLSGKTSSGRMLSLRKAKISRHEIAKERKRTEITERPQNNADRPQKANSLNSAVSAGQPENVLQSVTISADILRKCGEYDNSGTRYTSNGWNIDGFRVAAKFKEEELPDYSCSGLAAITVAMYSPLDIDLFVQRGDDIIYQQHVPASEIPARTATKIPLDSLVSLEGEGDLYIGYITPAYASTGIYPYGTDEEEYVEGGAEVYVGGNWEPLTNYYGSCSNFYIIGHVEQKGAKGVFNLYRQRKLNGIFVDEPELIGQNLKTSSYLDENLPGGEYCYWLIFASETMESCASDTACVFIVYRQTIKPINDIEKIYGDDDFKLDKAGTDGIIIASTADDIDYFAGLTVPVKIEIVAGSSIELTGSENDYNVKVVAAGLTQLRATQEGISDTLLPANPVSFDINVLKRDLYISVADQTKARGETFDPFTLNYNRFYNGDDESDLDVPVTVTCSATPVSPAGDYAIVIHTGLDDNYRLIPQNGMLHLINNINVANAFTPDSDGSNDSFMPGFKVKVFNRLGVLIYETKNAQQKEYGWDGRFQNSEQIVNPGVYYYILYDDNGKIIHTGSVNVVKK